MKPNGFEALAGPVCTVCGQPRPCPGEQRAWVAVVEPARPEPGRRP